MKCIYSVSGTNHLVVILAAHTCWPFVEAGEPLSHPRHRLFFSLQVLYIVFFFRRKLSKGYLCAEYPLLIMHVMKSERKVEIKCHALHSRGIQSLVDLCTIRGLTAHA